MSANAPLLTTASRLSATQDVDNYAAGVAAHINGDWSGHVQMEIINENWVDTCKNIIPGTARLRLQITVNGVDITVVVPVQQYVPALTGAAPAIQAQPKDMTVDVGKTAAFAVLATGDPILQYQWYKDNNLINGANAAQFVVTNAQLSSQGAYTCLVSNTYGSVMTGAGNLYVNFTVRSARASSGFSFLDVLTFPF